MFYTLSIPAQQKWAEKEGLSCNKEINEESGNINVNPSKYDNNKNT